MKIQSKAKRLIVLSVKAGKGYKNILLQAGATIEDELIKKSDISPYGKDIVEVKDEENTPNPVILPEEITRASLKELDVKDLKRWCKENKVKNYSKLNENEVITLILIALKIEEPQGGDNENN